MGSYATTTSISVKLPNFLDGNTTTSDSIGSSTFSVYMDKAEAIVNSAVGKKYSLPFTTVPPIIRDISFEIAAYYTIRAFSSRDWPNRNEMLDDFKTAFEMLEKIRTGDIVLADTSGSLIAQLSGLVKSNTSNYYPIFDVDTDTAWKVDDNRASDIESGRS